MAQRRILVIASQCESLGTLNFLPSLAYELYGVMIDSALGDCKPALEKQVGPLIDPTVDEADAAVRAAYQRASADEAMLILAVIGHGTFVGSRFYFLPRNGVEDKPTSKTGLRLVDVITEEQAVAPFGGPDGLVVLIDTCRSGVGAVEAAADWSSLKGGPRRFEVLTAAADRPAFEGCFTKTLIACLRDGLDAEPGEYLRCEHLRPIIEGRCPLQQPQHPTFNAGSGLFLARNQAHARRARGSHVAWVGTAVESEVLQRTEFFQPTPYLEQVVARSREHRAIALVGLAGIGKSTLAAALARPDVTEGHVPPGFVQAIALITGAMVPSDLAELIAVQLARSVPGFAEARDRFLQSLPEAERRTLDAFALHVLGPLRRLPAGDASIRIVLDGLDQLDAVAVDPVHRFLDALLTDPAFARARLVLSTRPDTGRPAGVVEVPVHRVDDALITSYLARRGVANDAARAIASRAEGNWLIARLLADLVLSDRAADVRAISAGLADLYTANLRRVGAASDETWRRQLRPVLGVLAVAGTEPVLPLALLCAASGTLGGPDRPARVRDVLADLCGLVVRAEAGTDAEHVGLFHATLAEFLQSPAAGAFAINPRECHKAVVAALHRLAPAEEHDARDALHRYAFRNEADHLAALGEYDRVVTSLNRRQSVIPSENLGRWKLWFDRIQCAVGPDHRNALTCRHNIAYWTDRAGDRDRALQLHKELLLDRLRVLGAHDPDTLATRMNVATSIGMAGNPREALRLLHELLSDQLLVIGANDIDTLKTIGNIADFTGQAGDPTGALRLFHELLPRQLRVLGEDHPDTLTTRGHIAYWTAESGNLIEALRLQRELLQDIERVLGPNHPETLTTRHNIANWTGRVGNADEALRLHRELLQDGMRVLGADHPDTLLSRQNIATWTAEVGDVAGGRQLLYELLPDSERVLGSKHPDTLKIRQNIASLTADPAEALRLFLELFPVLEGVRGPGHLDTLRTLHDIALRVGMLGNPAEAVRLFQRLLQAELSVLQPDHPQVLATRADMAFWTYQAGNPFESLQLFRELLPNLERVFGKSHVASQNARDYIAQIEAQLCQSDDS